MENQSKLTKELVAQESRFILEHLLNASQFNPEVQVEELRRLCQDSVSLRLGDYVSFLERFGYLSYDRAAHQVTISADGERVVSGEKMAELIIDVVHHFRPILARGTRAQGEAPLAAEVAKVAEQEDTVDGRYAKRQIIGSGGIGTVYLARQLPLEREVALKEVRELFSFFTGAQRQVMVQRFDEEVKKAALLCHPNVAAIFDANTLHEYPFVVSEYMRGGSLAEVLAQANEIPPELAVKIFLQLLHGLAHAHSQGVIHRSLKPSNILFDTTGNVRLTDFGVARVVERDQETIKHVYVGMGSVAYMAPEIFADPAAMGVASDLYAAGILLYEMLARKLPGRRSPMPTKLHASLPAVIDDIFDRLTQDEPGQRFSSAEEVLETFRAAEGAQAFLDAGTATIFLKSPIADLGISPRSSAPVYPTTEMGTEGVSLAPAEDGAEDVETSGGRKRRSRPYSYQQRAKERGSGESSGGGY